MRRTRFTFIAATATGDFANPNIQNLSGNYTGSATVGDLIVPGTLALTAEGDLTTGNLSAGTSLVLYATGNLSVPNITLTDPTGAASFDTTGVANFTGTVSSPTIYVTSGDINIASGASLGVLGVTQNLSFSAVTDQPVYIGAGLQPPAGAYVLNENGDIHASQITVSSFSPTNASTPDIYIGDVNIDGSQTPGGGTSSIIVSSFSGSVKILGTVHDQNAGASDSITFVTGNAFEVNTDTGRLAITDPSGNLTGSLVFESPNVWVADGSILQQLEADPNFCRTRQRAFVH